MKTNLNKLEAQYAKGGKYMIVVGKSTTLNVFMLNCAKARVNWVCFPEVHTLLDKRLYMFTDDDLKFPEEE